MAGGAGDQVEPNHTRDFQPVDVDLTDEVRDERNSDEMIPSHGDLNLGLTCSEEGEEEEPFARDISVDSIPDVS